MPERLKPFYMKKFNICLLLAVLCLGLAACGKEKKEETADGPEITEEEAVPEELSYPGAIRVAIPGSSDREVFGIMHGCILDVQTDEGSKNPVLTFRDDEDPENAWTVDTAFVKDVTLTPEKGERAALFFYGDIGMDPDSVEMIAVWPDGKYEIRVVDGVTAENTVDDFKVLEPGKGSGQGLRFVKNNCLADKDAMESPEGDSVRVVYVDSGAAEKYPLRIYRNTEGD